MSKVGIDNLSFYTARYALNLKDLAAARNIDPDKFTLGLGQQKMSVSPPDEDIVTMAATAAVHALENIDRTSIAMLLFATESGIDQSKAAGLYVHELLNLPEECRVVELKQACYSATMALQLSLPFLRENPDKKVLLIASDIARYGLNTAGESSQGCGAIAMLLSVNPRIIAFDPEYGVATESIMDFWRPNYLDTALVEGKYSSKLYLQMLEKTWSKYQERSQRHFNDFAYFCYHIPVPRLVEKAHASLAKLNHVTNLSAQDIEKQAQYSLLYSREMGNSYTAALYVGFTSLLENVVDQLENKRIGFYSYGSGCVAEFFSGIIQPQYQQALHKNYHQQLLRNRILLNYDEYEKFFTFNYPKDGSDFTIPKNNTGLFRLSAIRGHKRIYECVK